MALKATPKQYEAFAKALAKDRAACDMSGYELSRRIAVEGYPKAGGTLLNWERGDARPTSVFELLALERAMGIQPRGKYLRLLGWQVPETDFPAVKRLDPEEAIDARVTALEGEVATLREEAAEVRRLAEEIVRQTADQSELPPLQPKARRASR